MQVETLLPAEDSGGAERSHAGGETVGRQPKRIADSRLVGGRRAVGDAGEVRHSSKPEHRSPERDHRKTGSKNAHRRQRGDKTKEATAETIHEHRKKTATRDELIEEQSKDAQ